MSSELEDKTNELAAWIKEQPHLPQNIRKLMHSVFLIMKISK